MTCTCDLCTRNKLFRVKLAELPEDKQVYFEDLYDLLLNVEFDNDYYQATMSGKWPGGKEVLKAALDRYPKEESTLDEPNIDFKGMRIKQIPAPPTPPPARLIRDTLWPF
jgi:hypothetical protein